MVRKIAASYWTAIAIGFTIVGIHAWWLTRYDHAGEVLSGLGAALVVVGIYVAARPYIRSGLQPMINAGLPQLHAGFFGGPDTISNHRKRVAEALPAVVLDVWAERIVAVTVIVVGTLLNGYGTPIARVMGLRI